MPFRVVLLALFKLGLLWCLHIPVALAQHNCSNTGIYISSQVESGTATFALGDIRVLSSNINPSTGTANWMLNANADITLMAALLIDSGAIVRLNAGAQLTIYGDVINDGFLIVEPGAELKIFGKLLQNKLWAHVQDGATINNNTPGGIINFMAPRPPIPASVNATPCVLTNYNSGNFYQEVDGAGIAVDADIRVSNSNNLSLVNTDLRIEGQITFNTVDGDILLNNQNVVFNKNGKYSWLINNAYDAFLVTNSVPDSNGCQGIVRKEGIDTLENFIFPIGRQEYINASTRDFSPVLVHNVSANTQDVEVRVATYQEVNDLSLPIPYAFPSNPKYDHLWRIKTNDGGPIGVNMEHAVNVNHSNVLDYFFDAQLLPIGRLDALYAGNSNGLVDGPHGLGSGAGGVGNYYKIKNSSDSCGQDSSSWYFKTVVDSFSAFTLTKNGCSVDIKANLPYLLETQPTIEVYRQELDDSTHYTLIGLMKKTADSFYSLNDANPILNAVNKYYLKIITDHLYNYQTDTFTINTNCSSINAYPVPTQSLLFVTGLQKGQHLIIYNSAGKTIKTIPVEKACETVDLSYFASGAYIIVIHNNQKPLGTLKVIRK